MSVIYQARLSVRILYIWATRNLEEQLHCRYRSATKVDQNNAAKLC